MLENKSVDLKRDLILLRLHVSRSCLKARRRIDAFVVGVCRTQRFAFPNTFACRRYRQKKCDLLRSEFSKSGRDPRAVVRLAPVGASSLVVALFRFPPFFFLLALVLLISSFDVRHLLLTIGAN